LVVEDLIVDQPLQGDLEQIQYFQQSRQQVEVEEEVYQEVQE
jgi:hypothetical protein